MKAERLLIGAFAFQNVPAPFSEGVRPFQFQTFRFFAIRKRIEEIRLETFARPRFGAGIVRYRERRNIRFAVSDRTLRRLRPQIAPGVFRNRTFFPISPNACDQTFFRQKRLPSKSGSSLRRPFFRTPPPRSPERLTEKQGIWIFAPVSEGFSKSREFRIFHFLPKMASGLSFRNSSAKNSIAKKRGSTSS